MRGQVYMSKKLEKAKFKGLMNDCRQLWNEFDPIGVLDDEDGPRNEYDTYLPQTIRLVQSGADVSELPAYVRSVVHQDMGLTGFPEHEINEFAERLHQWRRI